MPDRYHGTAREIQFIQKMISPNPVKRSDLSPLEKLRRYQAAIRVREDWGRIDQKEIFLYVDHLLSKYEAFENAGFRSG